MDLGRDGLYHADVAIENLQSQGVCRSLKGTAEWSVYCTFLFYPMCADIVKLTSGQTHGYPYPKKRVNKLISYTRTDRCEIVDLDIMRFHLLYVDTFPSYARKTLRVIIYN